MLIVGLTGGIGSGKSTVAALFSELGVPIIDSDVVARDVIASDANVLKKIAAHFGQEILNEKHQLNRAALRERVFADIAQRRWLEALLHPLIVTNIEQRIAQLDAPYCIVVIPLLVEETVADIRVDRVLVVDATEELQIARTMQRDQHTADEVKRILASQATRAQRLARADDVLENHGDLAALRQEVWRLHERYL